MCMQGNNPWKVIDYCLNDKYNVWYKIYKVEYKILGNIFCFKYMI